MQTPAGAGQPREAVTEVLRAASGLDPGCSGAEVCLLKPGGFSVCPALCLCLLCGWGEPLLGGFALEESWEGADCSSWGCKMTFWVGGGLNWDLVPAKEASVYVSG